MHGPEQTMDGFQEAYQAARDEGLSERAAEQVAWASQEAVAQNLSERATLRGSGQ